MTYCRVAHMKWKVLVSDRQQETLLQIMRAQMNQRNKYNLKPIEVMLQNNPTTISLQRLFSLRLVDTEHKETFQGSTKNIINGFYDAALRHY